MHISFVFLVWLNSLLHSANTQFQTDFCKVDCANGRTSFVHTVCKRNYKCDPEPACEEVPPDQAFRDYMVRSHNELRNFIANGSNIQGYNHYKNPGAKNMNAVSYDLELEYVAQCWINTCITGEHDECRDVNRFFVGQNIYWGQRPNIKDAMSQESISLWFDEIQYMRDPNWIDSFPGRGGFPNDNKQRGHFTQVIWADTKYIGCARTISKRYNTQGTLICNYGPGGNMVDMSIYHLARDSDDIASECKVRNGEFKALCEESVSTSADGNVAPTCSNNVTGEGCIPPLLPPKEVPSTPKSIATRKFDEPNCSKGDDLTENEKEFCDWMKRHNKRYHSRGCTHRNLMVLDFLSFLIITKIV